MVIEISLKYIFSQFVLNVSRRAAPLPAGESLPARGWRRVPSVVYKVTLHQSIKIQIQTKHKLFLTNIVLHNLAWEVLQASQLSHVCTQRPRRAGGPGLPTQHRRETSQRHTTRPGQHAGRRPAHTQDTGPRGDCGSQSAVSLTIITEPECLTKYRGDIYVLSLVNVVWIC